MAGFISNLLGSGQANKASSSYKKAMGEITSGYDLAKPAISGGYSSANAQIKPFIESGTKANQMYGNLMGENGDEARDEAQGIYFSDDVLTKIRAMKEKQAGWATNSGGRFKSGVGALTDARVGLENYEEWKDDWAARADKGGQYAMQGAGLAVGEGKDMASLHYGHKQQMANLITGKAAAENAAANQGINNMVNLAAMATGAVTPGKSGTSAFGNVTNQMFGIK